MKTAHGDLPHRGYGSKGQKVVDALGTVFEEGKKKKGCPSPERLLPDSGFGLDRSYIRIHPSLALFNELFAISQDRETTLQFGSPSAFLFFFLKKKRTRKKATIPDGSRKQVESCVDSREHKFPIRV